MAWNSTVTMVPDSPQPTSSIVPTKKPTGEQLQMKTKLATIEIKMSVHSHGIREKEDLGDTDLESVEGIDFESASLTHTGSTAQMSSFSHGKGDMMREADAEILERGVCDSSAPSTPFQEPATVGPISPPSMELDGCMIKAYKQNIQRRAVECKHSEDEDMGGSDRDIIRHPVDVGMDIEGQNEIESSFLNESRCDDTRIPLKRLPQETSNLNGEIKGGDPRSYDSVSLSSPRPRAEQEAVEEEESPCLVARVLRPADYIEDENGNKTYHRRLHEAALFEKVVGEYPKNGLIQVIIDDDDDASSSSDDDEQQMIHVNDTTVDHNEEQTHISQGTNITKSYPETKESVNSNEQKAFEKVSRQQSGGGYANLDPTKIKNSLLQHHMTLENGTSEHSRFLDSLHRHKDFWEDSDHIRNDAEEYRFDTSYSSLLESDDKRSSSVSLPPKLQTRVYSEMHLTLSAKLTRE